MKMQRVILAIACLAAFVAALVMYTRNNRFPCTYHPDEPLKGEAVVSSKYHYRQPLLLIFTTDLMGRITGRDKTVQSAVETGRWVAATFGALAIVLLILTGNRVGGLGVALLVGWAALCSDRLLVWSHYMKEDSALQMGLGAFFLATAWYAKRPDRRTLITLGAACGLAMAGKYIGAVTLPFAALAIVWTSQQRGEKCDGKQLWQAMKHVLIGAAMVWCVLELPALLNIKKFFTDLRYEALHPLLGHRGLRQPILWASPFLKLFAQDIPPLIGALAVVGGVWIGATWRRRSVVERMLLVFPVVFFGLLLCSSIVNPRHLLPVDVGTDVLAALGVWAIVQSLPRGMVGAAVRGIVVAGFVVGTAVPFARTARADVAEFGMDTRDRLREWIRQDVPTTATIAYEMYVDLPNDRAVVFGAMPESYRLPQVTKYSEYLVSLGDVQALKAAGIEYAVVSETNYERFFDERQPRGKAGEEYRKLKAGYEGLFRDGELLQEIRPGVEMRANTSPVLRVYRIR